MPTRTSVTKLRPRPTCQIETEDYFPYHIVDCGLPAVAGWRWDNTQPILYACQKHDREIAKSEKERENNNAV